MTTWVEAAIILGRDPTAHVTCPTCGNAELTVRDVFREPRGRQFERYLECPACKTRNAMRMKLPSVDGLSVRIGNPASPPWGEERLAVTNEGVLTYDNDRGELKSRATGKLTEAAQHRFIDALAGWPFSEPAPAANLPPDSTIVDLIVVRDARESSRRVVYHLARKQPDYAPLLAMVVAWCNALRLPVAKRRPSEDLVDVVDVPR